MVEVIELVQGDSAELEALIDGQAVMLTPSTDPRMNTVTLHTFMNDLAQGIRTHEEIAVRYGFETVGNLLEYLQSKPEIVRRIKERRAIWQSDDATEIRIKKLSAHAVLDALHETGQIMMDTAHPPGTRIDALKAHARLAGVDAQPNPGKFSGPASDGSGRFSINIVFPNAGKTETFTTVVKTEPEPKTIEGEGEPEA